MDNRFRFHSFQMRVLGWLHSAFGSEVANDVTERNHRFLEESLELVQSLGCSKGDALQLVEYVYGRSEGEPVQEVGGVLLTLAGLCSAAEISMETAANKELDRVWDKIDIIRAKQAAKPHGSPLPIGDQK